MEDKLKMGVEDNDSKKLEQQKLLTGGTRHLKALSTKVFRLLSYK